MSGPRPYALALLLAAVTGFIALSYEIVWFRAFAFASGGSPVSFGLLLAFYLSGIAVGARATRRVCAAADAARLERALVSALLGSTLFAFSVLVVLNALVTDVPWTLLEGLVAFAAMGFGALFPLISEIGIPLDARAGRGVSRIYLANIIGSAAGSIVTGFVLLDVLGLRGLSVALAILGLTYAVAVTVALRWTSSARRRVFVASAVSAVLVVALAPRGFDRLYERLLAQRADNGSRFAELVENRHGVIALTAGGQVIGGGAYDGFISTDLVQDRNMIVRAYAISALHPTPRRVLIIGLSGGAWTQVIANAPGVEQVTAIEINPGYLELIAHQGAVRSLLSNPKVHIVIDDGRRWLVRHPGERFDVIVANTTFHWREQVTNLLSVEFLRLIRSHLADGGLYVFNTTGAADAFRTAFAVFPHGMRLVNCAVVSDAPVTFDRSRWPTLLTKYRIDGRLVLDTTGRDARARLDSLVAFANTIDRPGVFEGLEPRERMLSRLPVGPLITDDNMLTEWRPTLLR